MLIAVIAFVLTNKVLASANASHPGHYNSVQIIGVSFVLCAPLVLRNRFPLTAWLASAAAMLVVGRFIITPHSIGTAAYLPAGVLVYGLCLYAVSVRCATWVVVTAGAGHGGRRDRHQQPDQRGRHRPHRDPAALRDLRPVPAQRA